MNDYDKALLGLYGLSLLGIIVVLSDVWPLAAILILVLITSLVQKGYLEEMIANESGKRRETLDKIVTRLELFSRKLDDIRYDVGKEFYTIESRLEETRIDHQKEMDMNYRELARKIFDVENRLNATRKTFSAALGAMDDRIGANEDENN